MNSRTNIYLQVLCVIAVAVGFWLFNPFPLYFLNDDFIHIPLSKEGILFQRKSFRPICDLSIGLDYFLWKKKAVGYHFTNLLLHVTNTILVYFFSNYFRKKYWPTYSLWINVAVATLFFIYPYHSESIYWIIGRSGSLGTLFFLLSIIFYVNRNEKRFAFITSSVFFSLGLLTYESIWIFPLIALCFSWKYVQDHKTGIAKEIQYLAVLASIFMAFLVVRYVMIGELVGDYEASGFKNIHVSELFLNAVRLIVRSFAPPVESLATFYVAIGLLIVAAIVMFILPAKKEGKQTLLFLFVCFLISLLPYLSLGIDTHGVEGERFLYLPSVFVSLFLIHASITFLPKQNTQIVAVALLFVYCIFFLSASQKKYSIASNIAQRTMEEIHLLHGKNQLYVDSLPEEYKGALIFRLGFKEGVHWINNGNESKNIIVISTKYTWNTVPDNYRVLYKDSSYFSETKTKYLFQHKKESAAIFFTDSAMNIVK